MITWLRHFYFVDLEVWVRLPAPEYWPKPLIVKTGRKMGKPVIIAVPAKRLIPIALLMFMSWMLLRIIPLKKFEIW
jgi:hypothetical protein